MKTKTAAAVGSHRESASRDLDWEQLQIGSNRGTEPKPWVCNEASDVICLLEILAGDETVAERNPARVVEAARKFGDLLYQHEVEMLRDWLAGVPNRSKQAGQRKGHSFARFCGYARQTDFA